MKNKAIALLVAALLFQSCATVFTSKITPYQKTPPKVGEPKREIQYGFLIADILLLPIGLAIDFATGAIYRPAPKVESVPIQGVSQN